MSSSAWDAIIIGAGPAGSSAGALLAKHGLRVLILEKSEFPRFHIGESLLPTGLSVLDRIGLIPREDTFVPKKGAEFIGLDDKRQCFHFNEALPGCPPQAWHVDRANFDCMIRDRAIACGADVRHGEKVVHVQVEESFVELRTESEIHRALFCIDATGQSRLMARQNRSVCSFHQFGKASAFTHFTDLDESVGDEFGPDNNIRIQLLSDGWGWIIPLPESRLSIGTVTRTPGTHVRALEEDFLHTTLVRKLTHGATRLGTSTAQNYSFKNTMPCGPRFASVGDAGGFLDPVFSSGITLALVGAETLADLLIPAFIEGREGDSELLNQYASKIQRGYSTFASLIERFYNSRFANSMFLNAPPKTQMRRGVVSVLSGDVWRDDNPFQEMLLRAKRRGGFSLDEPS